uniref:Uncharacterized protein n=1 Tax=Ceratitis capitata TaxID=7213 RepID=W8BQQ9_CERCA
MEWKYQYKQKIQEREKLYQEFWQQQQQQNRQLWLKPTQQQQQQQEIHLQVSSPDEIQQLQQYICQPALSKSRKQRMNQKKRDENRNKNEKKPRAIDCVLSGMASAGVAVFMGVVGVAIMAADL